ncbi:cytochrome P450 [Ideonella sp. DXS29W]|uniref:Cytochrome P450 n=1 Tax=Ideonella lacteola TaxID=2984193 RepID=A0ABU9BQ17_9BURK
MSSPERFCPHYPAPQAERPSAWRMFFSKRRSWLDSLYARSYRMKMGEVHLPGVDLYMINEPALVRRVMVEEAAAFPKHAMLGDALRPLLGDSIFTTNGEVWQRQRALMDPSFEAARIRHVFGRMREAAAAMAERLRQVPQGAEHDVEIEMTHVAADIILRTILSQPLDSSGAQQIFAAFERYQALAPRLMMPAFFGLRWLRPWWQVRRSRKAASEIRTLLSALIRPRFDAARAGQATVEGDILATLLQVRDAQSGEGFSFDELVDQVAMLFLAGHETSASALSWALHLLANSPSVQERLHDEAATLFDPAGDDPSAIKDLALARNVFREALRLFPPVGFLARESAGACTMRDKQVPAHASVVISPWLIQRHRELWARPDEFDPDRYDVPPEAASGDDAALPVRESLRRAYLPFGMGPRVCIGAAFAQQEAALILATLAREFRFEPVAGHVPEPVGRLTIRAENGIRLRVYRREGDARR